MHYNMDDTDEQATVSEVECTKQGGVFFKELWLCLSCMIVGFFEGNQIAVQYNVTWHATYLWYNPDDYFVCWLTHSFIMGKSDLFFLNH